MSYGEQKISKNLFPVIVGDENILIQTLIYYTRDNFSFHSSLVDITDIANRLQSFMFFEKFYDPYLDIQKIQNNPPRKSVLVIHKFLILEMR
jgi:hypothetical protein